MNAAFSIIAGLCSLFIVFSILTLTGTYNFEYIQHSAAQDNTEECERLKENPVSSNSLKELPG